jgi:hypothetical protein
MIPSFLASLLISASTSAVLAQDSLKVQAIQQAPPSSISPEILHGLDGNQAFRIQDQQGSDFARIWLRKATPGSEKPGGPKGVIQFPFLADGELLGVLEFAKEGHDYRDQPVTKGVYTMRYGLQPVNGDHLGVSPYRDYILLLPASKDKAVAAPTRKQLEERSAEAAGTSHPASFLLLMAPAGAKPEPAMIHDTEKDTWGVILPLRLQVKENGEPMVYPVQLVVVGVSAA